MRSDTGQTRHGAAGRSITTDPQLGALSLRQRVFVLLDRDGDATDTRRPTLVAATLLPQLDTGNGAGVDRDTVARYVHAWRREVTTGRRRTPDHQLP